MAEPSRFSTLARIRSFGHALRGLGFMLRTQHNAWLHLAATLVVVTAGFVLRMKSDDWLWVTVAIAMVWVAEAFNTAIEYVCDVVSPGHSEAVKRAKDIAAGSVLICAVAATVIGAITFWPYARDIIRGAA